jgi:hypothetical protein
MMTSPSFVDHHMVNDATTGDSFADFSQAAKNQKVIRVLITLLN